MFWPQWRYTQPNTENNEIFSINFFPSFFQVNKIREQCQKQEETIKDQEGELDSRRSELQKLKDEETALEKEYDTNLSELQSLSTKLQDTQLQISQVIYFVTARIKDFVSNVYFLAG